MTLVLAAASAPAHDSARDPAAELAPGWGALGFAPPAPGSYALPPLFAAADGDVLSSDGSPSTLHRELGEGPALLAFIYASCSDVNGCPLSTAVFQKLKSRIAKRPELARRLQLVSLSFDPERDSPAVMRDYGRHFASAGVRWSFLTTVGRAELQPILDAYGQSVVREVDAEGRESGAIAHLLRVFLIDDARRVRNVYTVSFLHPDTLLADVETLLLESEAPKSANAEQQAGVMGAPRTDALRSGDDRSGYERADYESRSRALAARQGVPTDLLARLRTPPLGLPLPPFPADNPPTKDKVSLGRRLFFDRRLSHNETFSCAICHVPEQGFTSNELATAVGIEGRSVRRNSPTLLNVAYVERLFHDGRESRLENQIWGPLLARNEMGNPSVGAVLDRVGTLPDYPKLFERAFPGRGISVETLGMALASYERTLVSGSAPFDRWQAGEGGALSPAARRGFELFAGRAACTGCHPLDSPLLSDGAFHNTGVGHAASMAPSTTRASGRQRVQVAPGAFLEVERSIIASVSAPRAADLGRYEITGDPQDRWRYRTPTLRNVALTAPYMHDGSLSSLSDVADFYDGGGVPNEGLDPRIRPLGLSKRERRDLVAFLESLTGDDVGVLVSDAFAAPIGERD